MNTKDIVNHLNDILKRNYDAEEGYKNAAEKVESQGLKQFFLDLSSDRYDFGHQVKSEIKNLGGEPNKGTSIEGDIHRTWMNLREFFSEGDDSLIKECERGEKAAIEEYDEMLNDNDVPESVKTILRNQKQSIQGALTKLESLER